MLRLRRWILIWIAVFSVVWLATAGAGTERLGADATVEEFELKGHICGPAMATAAYDDFALMGYSFEFAVLQATKPEHPQLVDYLTLPSNNIGVVGTLAYGAGRGVLNIVSLQNTLRPQVIGIDCI